MIVADTNLIAQLVLKLDWTDSAQAVYRRDAEWIAPALWQHEFLNVLANYLRFDGVPYTKLVPAWRNALGLFADATRPVDMLLALKIAGERTISAYDAQYVALAQSLNVPLITEDRKLRRAVPEFTMSMTDFLSR